MFTRLMTCTVKPEKKDAFLQAAHELTAAYKSQAGFVDLLTFTCDEHPDQALVAVLWKTQAEAAEFYKNHAPLLDLRPFLKEDKIEHYHLETSTVFQLTAGKAA